MPEIRKRETAYKVRIGQVLNGHPIIEKQEAETTDGPAKEKFKFLELADKQVQRINIIANVIDKYISEGEKRFATLTIDDATGQIRIKAFGEDVAKMQELNQGDTIVVIGFLRSYNNELYILPEVVKKTDPRYLLVRKLEIESKQPKLQTQEQQTQNIATKDQILKLIKDSEEQEGIDVEQIILKITSATPEEINQEIKKLLEEGIIYEPRPGRVRYLG
jgi:RPA family protein